MNFITKLTLSKQLMLIVFIPIIAIIFFVAFILQTEYHEYKNSTKLQVALNISFDASNLVHELQKERGLTAGFLGSKGKKFKDKLSSQRVLTDKKIQLLKIIYSTTDTTIFSKEFIGMITLGMEQLKEIETIRNNIDSLGIEIKDAISFYSTLNKKYLNGVTGVSSQSSNAELLSLSGAFSYFLNAKELAGIERAVINQILSQNKKVSNELMFKWNGLFFGQNTLMDSFLSLAHNNSKQYYNNTVQGESVNIVNSIRQTVRNKSLKGDFDIEPTYWFEHSTNRINLLREVSKQQITLLRHSVDKIIQESTSNLYLHFSIGFLVLLLVIVIVSYISIKLNKFFDIKISGITNANNQIVSASYEIAGSATMLAESSSSQAASVEEISATIEQTSATIEQTANNSREADILSSDASSSAQEGYEKVKTLLVSMNEITSSSKEIANIIKTIDEIAFQTNLLALNAAVEAARAGEHGLGFAVVADEVRNLAGKSANAAKETATIIEHSLSQVNNGNKIANDTHKAFEEIMDKIKKSSNLVSEISLASKEQTEGMKQINKAMNQIDEVTQTVASTSEESAAASEELNAQAVSMGDTISSIGAMVGYKPKSNK